MKVLNGKATATAATLAVAVVGWGDPARAASATTVPGAFHSTRGAATATGTVQFQAGWPGSYTVTGSLTVSRSDGQCYYVRYYVRQDVLGSGSDSPRQCGPGMVVLQRSVAVPLTGYGLDLGLCTATPGAPEEAVLTPPGANCTII